RRSTLRHKLHIFSAVSTQRRLRRSSGNFGSATHAGLPDRSRSRHCSVRIFPEETCHSWWKLVRRHSRGSPANALRTTRSTFEFAKGGSGLLRRRCQNQSPKAQYFFVR